MSESVMLAPPTQPPTALAARYRRSGYAVCVAVGACLVCEATGSTGWTEAALNGLRHRFPDADLAVGHVCAECEPFAQGRARSSREEMLAEALARPPRPPEPDPAPTPAPAPRRPRPKVGRIEVPDQHRRQQAQTAPAREPQAPPMVTPKRGEALTRLLHREGVRSARWERDPSGRGELTVDEADQRRAQQILNREASR